MFGISTSWLVYIGIAAIIVGAVAGIWIYMYRHTWKKAEQLGAAEEKAESSVETSTIGAKAQKEIAEAQAQRKTPSEYRDWVASKGTNKGGKKK